MSAADIKAPHPRPCESCPYRLDAPSGLWSDSEYLKLTWYDKPTGEQPLKIFTCHQGNGHVCSGWVACASQNKPGHEYLSLRFGVYNGIPEHVIEAVCRYVSPVPLWSSGTDAAKHGLRDYFRPGREAKRMRHKLLWRPGIKED